jgi:hypothetical protein
VSQAENRQTEAAARIAELERSRPRYRRRWATPREPTPHAALGASSY